MSLIEPTFFERHKAACIIGGLVIVLAIVCLIFWAYSDNTKKEGELIGNVGVANGKNAVIGNLVINAEKDVNNAANNTNQAVNNYRESVNRDSSEFGSSGSEHRFCTRWPCDSTCREWRKRNEPNLICD